MIRFLVLLLLLAGPLATFAQTSTGNLQYGGLTRDYRVHVPPSYNASTPAALVFNLHGYTSNALQQEFYSGMNAVADTAGFIVCYPNGVNNAWNSAFTPPYNGGVDDVGFISVLIDELASQYNIDLARVYSCGMSNGGFMSFRLACDLENRIAAIGSVTGTMSVTQFANCNASRPVPVLQIHGDLDPTVAYYGNGLSEPVDSVLSYWRQVNGCVNPVVHDTLPDLVAEGSTVTTQHWGGCQAGTEVLHYKVANGGHTWPGAFPIPTGITNQDIDASVEIWKFFLRHTHPNPILVGVEEEMGAAGPRLGNSAHGGGWILMGAESDLEYEVRNVAGQLVMRGDLEQGERLVLENGGLARGLYVIRFSNGSSLKAVRR